MENSANRVVEAQRRTLDFMLDSLGLRHAYDEGFGFGAVLPIGRRCYHKAPGVTADAHKSERHEDWTLNASGARAMGSVSVWQMNNAEGS